MNLLKPIIKGGKAAAKVEVKDKPFFSAVDRAALELARTKGTGKEFMTELKKVPGVKPAEIQHRKLERLEALPKMEKADFLKQLESNPPIGMEESVKIPETRENLQKLTDENNFVGYFDELDDDDKETIRNQTTKYDQYKLPGGSNYREILLQTPTFGGQDLTDLMSLEAMERRGGIGTRYGVENLDRLRKKREEMGEEYNSLHWEGDPNVLAHMRVQDRLVEQPPEMRYVAINKNSGFSSQDFATPEELDAYIKTLPENIQGSLVVKQAQIAKPPKKVLHVEEIQSDWHQQGRKKGYKDPQAKQKIAQIDELKNTYDELNKRRWSLHEQAKQEPDGGPRFQSLMDEANSITPKLLALNSQMDDLRHFERTQQGAVPDAPFKKNWHELAMKRLINYAAENGYDSIAITPGVEQAKRYDLSKHINDLEYDPQTQKLSAWDHNGNKVIDQSGVSEDQLPEYIGKEGASKLLAKNPEDTSVKQLFGADLQVGGEGMAGFYDKMIPDYLNSFGKKYGSQVEMSSAPVDSLLKNKITDLHTFSITPEMREEVTSKGVPLYQKIGVPLGTGAAGAEMEAPEPVEQVEEPAYAAGGAVDNTTPDMRDGGQIIQGSPFKRGGKVHVTNNTDAMFMDVHDKMFKRK